MATYLQGITDYIPQIQPFTPDYNFYSRSLQFSQNKHDAAKSQLSNLYGSLLNAPMTREDNLQTRSAFFEAINGDIKKLSGMDLSIGANSQQGNELFSRLYDNDNVVRDMVWTKHFQKQMEKGSMLKNCADPEKCGGSWWEEGDRYMNYKRQEFASATADDAMKIGMVDYVAQQDVMGMATKMAKEAGLSMEIDQLQGGYITTTKNGPLLSGPLSNLFAGSIAKNGKVLDYYRTKAYVDRKDFGLSNKDKYGSIESAEQVYITENSNMLQELYDKQEKTTTNNAETTNKIKEEIATEVRDNGANPKSSVFDVYNKMGQEADAYQSSASLYTEASGENKMAANSMQGRALDRSMAAFYLGNDINKAASTLAYKDYKFKMKADEYSLEATRQKNRLVMEDYKQKNKLDFEQFKFDLKQYEDQLAAQGSSVYNTPSQVDVAGATDSGPALWAEDGEQTYDKLEAGATQFKEDRQKLVNDLSAPEKMILENAFQATESSAVQGNTQARADYVAMAKEYLKGKANTDAKTGLDVIAFSDSWAVDNDEGLAAKAAREAAAATELSSSREALRKLDNAGNLDQQFNIARQLGINVKSLSGSDADQMYMNTFEKFSQTDANGENVSRPYLRQVNQLASQLKNDINAKRSYLGKMDEAYANLSQGVINKVKGGMGGYSKSMQDAMEAYIDPITGHAREYVDFERAYKLKGYSSAQAKEIYRQDRQYTPFEERDADDLAAGQKAGATQNNTWDISDGIYNYAASGVDMVGTTVLGIAGTVIDALEWVMPFNDVEEGQWNSWGYDYDSPTDVANWEDSGYSSSKNIDGKGNPGLLDTWKRAFSSLADPPGDYGWMNVHGLGNKAVKGLNFDMVDPQYPASLSMLGTTGMLKNTFSSKEAIVAMGGFASELPTEIDPVAKRIAALAYTDMTQNPKGAGRLTPNITYTNIAGGNDDWVGMNMKFSEGWVQKFKGSEDDPGATRNFTNQLVTDGITMYVPKAEARNIFTQNAERTSLDILMDYNGEIGVDASPKYTKGVRIKKGIF